MASLEERELEEIGRRISRILRRKEVPAYKTTASSLTASQAATLRPILHVALIRICAEAALVHPTPTTIAALSRHGIHTATQMLALARFLWERMSWPGQPHVPEYLGMSSSGITRILPALSIRTLSDAPYVPAAYLPEGRLTICCFELKNIQGLMDSRLPVMSRLQYLQTPEEKESSASIERGLQEWVCVFNKSKAGCALRMVGDELYTADFGDAPAHPLTYDDEEDGMFRLHRGLVAADLFGSIACLSMCKRWVAMWKVWLEASTDEREKGILTLLTLSPASDSDVEAFLQHVLADSSVDGT